MDKLLKELKDRLTDLPIEQQNIASIASAAAAKVTKLRQSYDALENPTPVQTARVEGIEAKLSEVQESIDDDTLGNAIVPEDAPLPPQAFVDAALVALAEADVVDGAFVLPATGNATVPENAPIQPPQAFVDLMTALSAPILKNNTNRGEGLYFALAGAGQNVTSINNDVIEGLYWSADLAILNEKAFTLECVNRLLNFFVTNYLQDGGYIDISGGTSAAPTGQGLTDKATLISNGWTVITN